MDESYKNKITELNNKIQETYTLLYNYFTTEKKDIKKDFYMNYIGNLNYIKSILEKFKKINIENQIDFNNKEKKENFLIDENNLLDKIIEIINKANLIIQNINNENNFSKKNELETINEDLIFLNDLQNAKENKLDNKKQGFLSKLFGGAKKKIVTGAIFLTLVSTSFAQNNQYNSNDGLEKIRTELTKRNYLKYCNDFYNNCPIDGDTILNEYQWSAFNYGLENKSSREYFEFVLENKDETRLSVAETIVYKGYDFLKYKKLIDKFENNKNILILIDNSISKKLDDKYLDLINLIKTNIDYLVLNEVILKNQIKQKYKEVLEILNERDLSKKEELKNNLLNPPKEKKIKKEEKNQEIRDDIINQNLLNNFNDSIKNIVTSTTDKNKIIVFNKLLNMNIKNQDIYLKILNDNNFEKTKIFFKYFNEKITCARENIKEFEENYELILNNYGLATHLTIINIQPQYKKFLNNTDYKYFDNIDENIILEKFNKNFKDEKEKLFFIGEQKLMISFYLNKRKLNPTKENIVHAMNRIYKKRTELFNIKVFEKKHLVHFVNDEKKQTTRGEEYVFKKDSIVNRFKKMPVLDYKIVMNKNGVDVVSDFKKVVQNNIDNDNNTTFFFSGHGSESNEFAFQNARIMTSGNTKFPVGGIDIHARDLQNSLDIRYKNTLNKNYQKSDVFIFNQCFSSNFIDYFLLISDKKLIANNPVFVGMSEIGQMGYHSSYDGFLSESFINFFKFKQSNNDLTFKDFFNNDKCEISDCASKTIYVFDDDGYPIKLL